MSKLGNFTSEERLRLLPLELARQEYYRALVMLSDMTVRLLGNYTPAGDEERETFIQEVVSPLKKKVNSLAVALVGDTVSTVVDGARKKLKKFVNDKL
jgi:hypothetical protein